jgi:heme exporter protein B
LDSFFKQTWKIAKISLRSDLHEPSAWFSSLLFSLTTLIILGFAVTIDPNVRSFSLEVGITLVVLFFTLQTSLGKSFDKDIQDRSIDLFCFQFDDLIIVYLGKYLANFIFNLSLLIPILFLANVFLFTNQNLDLFNFKFIAIILLMISGICALGGLLSALVYQSSGRSSLFPILFYPLLLPLLIVGVQGVLAIHEGSLEFSASNDGDSWIKVLMLLNLVYLGVGSLLFSSSLKN